MRYTAADIKILTPAQAGERFFYVAEACELACFPVRDAARRYLDGDASVPVTPELVEAHRELSRRTRR